MRPTQIQKFAMSAALAVLCVLPAAPSARSEPDIPYPVVFTSPAALEEHGLSVEFYDKRINWYPKPRLNNSCFVIDGEGGYVLSVSDEFLARHKVNGFTIRSLCLGLVSEIRFDPQTGRRLPTIIARDIEGEKRELAIVLNQIDTWTRDELQNWVPREYPTKAALKEALQETQSRYNRGDFNEVLPPDNLPFEPPITEEIPLVLPSCFKNGTPYLDCDWQYGMKSGRKTVPGLAENFKKFGEELDRQISDYIAHTNFKQQPDGSEAETAPDVPEMPYLKGEKRYGFFWRDTDGTTSSPLYKGQPAEFACDLTLANLTDYRFFTADPEFPRGYGYALSVIDARDNATSTSAFLSANDKRRHHSRVNTALLKKKLSNWGRD